MKTKALFGTPALKMSFFKNKKNFILGKTQTTLATRYKKDQYPDSSCTPTIERK